MEGIDDITQQRKTKMAQSFKLAAWGAAICIASEVVGIFSVVKQADSLDTLSEWVLILGFIVWGAGLIGAGTNLCNMGHEETGVRSAGGALIFAAIINFIILIGVDEETMLTGTMGYVWMALSLLGPGIFYLSFKQEKEKEDKFFDLAAMGMGTVIIVAIALFVAFKLVMYAAEGEGVSAHTYGGYTVVEYSRAAVFGNWIGNHIKMVLIIAGVLNAIGYLMAFCDMCTYNDFIDDLKEEKSQKETQELINEVVADYKDRKADNETDGE